MTAEQVRTDVLFVPYNEAFLERSWVWLRDPEIKYLTDTPELTREAQRAWFDGLEGRTDYYVWGITLDHIPIGAVGLKHVNRAGKRGEYFGYIGEKNCWGQGIGVQMLDYICGKAREMGLRELYLHVIPGNLRAARLYQRYGFLPRPSDPAESEKTIAYTLSLS